MGESSTIEAKKGDAQERPEYPAPLSASRRREKKADKPKPVVNRPESPKPKETPQESAETSKPKKKKKLRVIYHPPSPQARRALREWKQKRRTERMQDARDSELEEFIGYDVQKARKAEELERVVKLLKKSKEQKPVEETPEQKVEREHLERLDAARAALYRDDRGKLRRMIDTIRAFRFATLRNWMQARFGLDVRPWHLAVPAFMLVIMFTVHVSLFGLQRVEAAPSEYGARCGVCKFTHDIDREAFDMLSFHRMHPDHFEEQYPGEAVPEPACPRCHVVFNELTLACCPTCGDRFLVAQTEGMDVASDAKAIQLLCVNCDK